MSVPISNVTRRVVYAPSGTGPYAFTFNILAQTDIEVYKGDNLLTLTTDYTVTINANGTGSVTLVATAGTDNITIIGARAIQRLSDFVTGGDFFANTVNTELDSLTIFAQQNAEGLARSLQAPETDPTTINMTLPRAADRADKFLAFDASGNPVPGAVPDEIQDVLAIETEIIAVAAIDTEIVAVSNLSTDQLSAVASVTSDIQTLAAISDDIAEIALLTTDQLTAIASSTADIATLAGISSDITAVAAISTDDISALVALSTSDLASVATVTSDIAAISPFTSEIQAVAALNTDQLSAISNVTSEIATLAPISADITTVAGIDSDVTAVAADATDIGTVAGSIANVNTVAGIAANVTTVAGISADVTAVAGDATDIGAVAAIAANVTTVAGVAANVTTVAGISSDVTTVATNVVDITNFSDVYLGPAGSDPATRNDSSALQAGDLYFDTVNDIMKVYTGSAWLAAYVSGDGFLATTGGTMTGDLTMNAQADLRFADSDSSNWVAFQAPATVSSNVTWTLPAADGSNGQAIVTNGSGTLSFGSAGISTGKAIAMSIVFG
jgi:hypothetical protein